MTRRTQNGLHGFCVGFLFLFLFLKVREHEVEWVGRWGEYGRSWGGKNIIKIFFSENKNNFPRVKHQKEKKGQVEEEVAVALKSHNL